MAVATKESEDYVRAVEAGNEAVRLDMIRMRKDAERFRKFLELYDTEEMTAAQWGGQKAIIEFLDAATLKTPNA